MSDRDVHFDSELRAGLVRLRRWSWAAAIAFGASLSIGFLYLACDGIRYVSRAIEYGNGKYIGPRVGELIAALAALVVIGGLPWLFVFLGARRSAAALAKEDTEAMVRSLAWLRRFIAYCSVFFAIYGGFGLVVMLLELARALHAW